MIRAFSIALLLAGCGSAPSDTPVAKASSSPATTAIPTAPPTAQASASSAVKPGTLSDGRPIPADVADFLRSYKECAGLQSLRKGGAQVRVCPGIDAEAEQLVLAYRNDRAVQDLLEHYPPFGLKERVRPQPDRLPDGREIPEDIAGYLLRLDHCHAGRMRARSEPNYDFIAHENCLILDETSERLQRKYRRDRVIIDWLPVYRPYG